MRILVVEDEAPLADAIARGLRREGMAVDVAYDGETGHEKSTVTRYDVVVLDRDLPGMSGDELCKEILSSGALTRVMMLTASGSIEDRVSGLSLGADDYLAKPFAFPELVARVRALARRATPATPPVLAAQDVELDPARRTVSRGGQPIELTRKEFALISILSRNKGRVVPREQLLDQVWGLEYYGEARTLDVHISGLRKKLGVCGNCIETVIGIGYRFRGCTEISEAVNA